MRKAKPREKFQVGQVICPMALDPKVFAYEYRVTVFDGEDPKTKKPLFRYLTRCIRPGGGAVSFPTDAGFWMLDEKVQPYTPAKGKTVWEIMEDRARG